MGATGGSVRRLTDFGYHPAWSPDGKEIVIDSASFDRPDVVLSRLSQFHVVDVATGMKRQIAVPLRFAAQPRWSPHGHRIAYWGMRGGSGHRDIWTVPGDAGNRTAGNPVPVTDDPFVDWNPVWSPDGGYLYFSSERGGSTNLWRVRIDEVTGEVLGSPHAVTTPSSYSGYVSLSRNGQRIAYVQQLRTSNIYRVQFDPTTGKIAGPPIPVTAGSREAYYPDLSPDGRTLVFAQFGLQEDIFLVGADGTGFRHLTNDAPKDRAPRWSPDGRWIAFMSNRGGKFEFWALLQDVSGLRQLTDYPGKSLLNPVWSPDSARLVVTPMADNSLIMEFGKPWREQGLQILPPLSEPDAYFMGLSWSPDGRKSAGDRIRADGTISGISIYSLDTRRYRTLTAFGTRPHWLSDSRRLLFSHRDKLYLADSVYGNVLDILTVAPYEITRYNLAVSPNDRLIYFSLARTESDVWLMSLK